jgi:hypothetical protein
MDAEDISIASGWDGEPQEFVGKLCEIGFLEECEEGIYHIHDWDHHNPFAAFADERSERAREAAKARWNKEHAKGMQPACDSHASGKTSHQNGNAPSPSPSPTPKKKNTSSVYTDEFERFWQAYPRKIGKGAAFRTWKKLNGTRPDADELVRIVEQHKRSEQWKRDGGQYIPHPQTWLNQERWNDELSVQVEAEDPDDLRNLVY